MTANSRKANSIRNITTGLGGYFINTIFGFICRTFFIKYLATDYLGINGLFTNILTILSLAELGIGSAIIYELYKPLAYGDMNKVSSLMRFYGKAYRWIGTIVFIFGLLMLPFLKVTIREIPNIKESIYLIYIIYLFNTASSYFFSYRSSLISANQQHYIINGLSYIITILQSIIQIVLLVLTKEYLPYLLVQTVGTFAYNILISYIAVKKFPNIISKEAIPLEKVEKNNIITNVKALIITKLSGILVNNTDNIIISYISGLTIVGYYSNYVLLTSTLNTVLRQIFNGITASIGNYNAIESNDKKIEMFDFINLANFWLFGWATIGIAITTNDIIKLWVGDKYLLSISIPIILAFNFYIVGMQNAIWMYKSTLGLFKYGRYLLIITAIIDLSLAVFLGKHWGLFGILIAGTIARILTNVWYDPYAVLKYGLHKLPYRYFVKYILYMFVLFITGGICFISCSFVNFPSILWNILIKICICSIIPNLVFFLLFHKRREFYQIREILNNVISRIKLRNIGIS